MSFKRRHRRRRHRPGALTVVVIVIVVAVLAAALASVFAMRWGLRHCCCRLECDRRLLMPVHSIEFNCFWQSHRKTQQKLQNSRPHSHTDQRQTRAEQSAKQRAGTGGEVVTMVWCGLVLSSRGTIHPEVSSNICVFLLFILFCIYFDSRLESVQNCACRGSCHNQAQPAQPPKLALKPQAIIAHQFVL